MLQVLGRLNCLLGAEDLARTHGSSGKQLGGGCRHAQTSPEACGLGSKQNQAEAFKESGGFDEAWECPSQAAKAPGAHWPGAGGGLVCK